MITTRDSDKDTLSGFASVDQANSSQFARRLDAMHALEFFGAYKQETFLLMQPK